MDAPDASEKKRLKIMLCIILGLFLLLCARLVKIMVIDGEEMTEKAESQQTRNTLLSATRGKIIDSTGTVLARNATAYKIVVWPQSIKADERERVARELSNLLDMDYAKVLERISSDKQEIILARQVEREIVDKIDSMKLGSGVGTAIDTKRYYSSGALFAQLLGFTTVDGEGQAGLEQKYDEYLAGTQGRTIAETDAKGNALAYGVEETIEATDGDDIILTTDAVMQSALEEACAEMLEVNNAETVQGIIMDCTTGEIKAITTQPDFDPNSPPRSDMTLLSSVMRNRVVADSFEPGSAFELITLAAALDSGTVNTETNLTCTGSSDKSGNDVTCSKRGGHGAQTLEQALQNGCDTCLADIALDIGTETFYDYLYSFGFGSSTGSGINGESAGNVTHQKYVTKSVLARIGIGEDIEITPIQLASAVCAAVNGGNLMQPYVVDRIVAQDGTVVLQNSPTVVRRVISQGTSALVRQIAQSMVSDGSCKNAAVPGYDVGGMSGVSYSSDDAGLTVSFIGFAPADDPKYVCLILADGAQVGEKLGNYAAAPYFRQVTEEVLMYSAYLPESTVGSVLLSDVTGTTVAEAKSALKELGLEVITQDDENELVTAQVPAAGSSVKAGSPVLLYTVMTSAQTSNGVSEEDETVTVPDVLGKTRLAASDALKAAGLTIKIDPPDQSGKAIRQSPAAGESVLKGTEVLVEFSDTGIG